MILSDIPFQPIDLEHVNQVLAQRYPDALPTYTERRDATGRLRATLRTFTNATHALQVRNITDLGLSYREIPQAAQEAGV